MTDSCPVIVLGVGNTLMQDDGIGVWAIRALAEAYDVPAHLRLIEGGTAGLRLLAEFDGVEHLVIIDAVAGKKPPGSIYRFGPEELPRGRGPLMSAHEVGIVELLSVAEFLGKCPHTRILGVQPLETGEVGLELTPPLQEALPHVVAAIVEELQALGIELAPKKAEHEGIRQDA